MAALKAIYRRLYQLLNSLVLMFSAYSLGYSIDNNLQWLCLSVIALAPLVPKAGRVWPVLGAF